MKRKPGRPKTLKAKEVKKPFPMRFSDKELKVFKLAAGDQPLREWMRLTLIQSIFGITPQRNQKIVLLASELLMDDDPPVQDEGPVPLP